MKKFRLFVTLCLAGCLVGAFNACSDDDPVPEPEPTPTPKPDPDPEPEPTPDPQTWHFDLTMTVGKHGGMNRDKVHYVISLDSLTAGESPIDLKGKSAEISDYTTESVFKGAYYYQVPNSGDRFSKLTIADNKVNVIAERPFGQNTYKERSYSTTWLNDNTLLIMSATGDYQHIIWTKLNTDDMSILAEGTIDGITVPEGYEKLSTSGILTYRESDNKLFYFYFGKKGSGMRAESTPFFYTAVINPETMTLESNKPNTLAREMAGSAYGELLQSSVLYDEQGDLYLAAFSEIGEGKSKVEKGQLIRIKKGETDFDPSYEGFPDSDGKLLTIQYLGNRKVLAYTRNDGAGTSIDDYSHYYVIIDLDSHQAQRLAYEGQEIPYSSGRFAQRTALADGKYYIGVNTENANPCIYIYDVASGDVTKGAEIVEGYYFEQIRVLDNVTK